MYKTLKVLFTSLGLLIIACLVILFCFGFKSASTFFGFDIENVVFHRDHGEYVFSLVEKAPIIIFVGLIFTFLFFFIAYKPGQFVDNMKKAFSLLWEYMRDTFCIIRQSKVKYFLLIFFCASIYFAFAYPVTLDEPQSYFFFINPPTWEALAFYPYPNNHILSSVLSGITNMIPGLDLLFKIRIPVLFISLLTWVFAYRFVRKYYSENLALFLVAIGSVVVTNLQHAYIARGYAYVTFFVVVGLYAAFNIIKEGNRRRDWTVFAVSSALGAFTMPSYLYPFLSLSIFIFIFNYKSLKTQILYSALVGVLVIVLYSPLLVVTGLDGLTSNEYVATIDRLVVLKSLPGFMLGTVVHIFYVPFYILAVAFGLVGLFTIYKRDKNVLILWAVFLITPCLFLILHSVIPFFRTFFYYGFLFVFLIGISFKDEIARVGEKILFSILLGVHLLMLLYFVYISRDLMPDVFMSADLRKEVLKNDKTYYFHSGIPYLEGINMEFEIERQNFSSKVVYGSDGDVAKLPHYDYYLIKQKADFTIKYKPSLQMNAVFSTPINVYNAEDFDK